MKLFKHGIIDYSRCMENYGIEALLMPSIFMGTILSPKNRFDIMAFTRSPSALAIANKRIGLNLFKDGQFVYEHQYLGHQCLTEALLGIFMPLDNCDDSQLRQTLLEITRKFRPREGRLHRPEAKEYWERVLRESPLPNDFCAINLDEALIRFDAEKSYPTLKRHFKYITEFAGLGNDDLQPKINMIDSIISFDLNDSSTLRWSQSRSDADVARLNEISRLSVESRRISQQESLPWDDINGFAQWLTRSDDFMVKAQDITIALMYENSD